MFFRLAADGVLLLHVAFILFAVLGAALAIRWRWIPYVHVPAAIWGVYVELSNRVCPLTYLENHFRALAGQAGYTESFLDHYVLAIVYPSGLTRDVQLVLAGIVIAVNFALYGWLFLRRRRGI